MSTLLMTDGECVFEVREMPCIKRSKKSVYQLEVRETEGEMELIKIKKFMSEKNRDRFLQRAQKEHEEEGFRVTTRADLARVREESQIFNGVTLNSCNVVDLDSNRVILTSKEKTSKPSKNLAVYVSLMVPMDASLKIVGVLLQEDRSYVCAANLVENQLSIRKRIEVTPFSPEWMIKLVRMVRNFLTKLQEIRLRYKVQRAAFVGRNIDDYDLEIASTVQQEFRDSEFRVAEEALVSAVKFGRILIF